MFEFLPFLGQLVYISRAWSCLGPLFYYICLTYHSRSFSKASFSSMPSSIPSQAVCKFSCKLSHLFFPIPFFSKALNSCHDRSEVFKWYCIYFPDKHPSKVVSLLSHPCKCDTVICSIHYISVKEKHVYHFMVHKVANYTTEINIKRTGLLPN